MPPDEYFAFLADSLLKQKSVIGWDMLIQNVLLDLKILGVLEIGLQDFGIVAGNYLLL